MIIMIEWVTMLQNLSLECIHCERKATSSELISYLHHFVALPNLMELILSHSGKCVALQFYSLKYPYSPSCPVLNTSTLFPPRPLSCSYPQAPYYRL